MKITKTIAIIKGSTKVSGTFKEQIASFIGSHDTSMVIALPNKFSEVDIEFVQLETRVGLLSWIWKKVVG